MIIDANKAIVNENGSVNEKGVGSMVITTTSLGNYEVSAIRTFNVSKPNPVKLANFLLRVSSTGIKDGQVAHTLQITSPEFVYY